MSLLSRLREKQAGKVATATPATFATQAGGERQTVASVATVAVAKPPQGQTARMTSDEEQAIRAWLALIGETDPVTMAEVIDNCRRDAGAREYFVGRATTELPRSASTLDDRRTCHQCANLVARRCQAAKRGEIVASRNYEPIRDIPRRCEGYVPGTADSDRRLGRERWPNL